MIALRHVAKTFGARLILRDCTAEFREGSVSLVTGENGAGKSTLLRIIAGLSQPSSGKVSFAPAEPSIGFLGHQTFLYPALTALENLAFWQKAHGLPAGEAALLAMLEHVNLARHAHERAGVFSRGMAQRLSLARILLQRPDVLLLDEPGTGLDQASQTMLEEEILEARKRGATVVCVSHNLERARALADCVWRIRERRLELEDAQPGEARP